MKINIGTTKKNIINYEINKRYEDITYSDIKKIVEQEIGDANVVGWAPSKTEENYDDIEEDIKEEDYER